MSTDKADRTYTADEYRQAYAKGIAAGRVDGIAQGLSYAMMKVALLHNEAKQFAVRRALAQARTAIRELHRDFTPPPVQPWWRRALGDIRAAMIQTAEEN